MTPLEKFLDAYDQWQKAEKELELATQKADEAREYMENCKNYYDSTQKIYTNKEVTPLDIAKYEQDLSVSIYAHNTLTKTACLANALQLTRIKQFKYRLEFSVYDYTEMQCLAKDKVIELPFVLCEKASTRHALGIPSDLYLAIPQYEWESLPVRQWSPTKITIMTETETGTNKIAELSFRDEPAIVARSFDYLPFNGGRWVALRAYRKP
jgi:hypothetical protein